MSDTVQSMVLAPAGLYLPFVLALVLTLVRRPRRGGVGARRKLVGLLLIGIACQCAHAVEEVATGIHVRFPPLFGLAPVSAEAFVGFNGFWIGVWLVSAVGVWHGSRAAYFPVWFFALAMSLNGLAHPLLALWVGGYFPGLVTAPVVGLLGVVLTKRLFEGTETGAASAAPAPGTALHPPPP